MRAVIMLPIAFVAGCNMDVNTSTVKTDVNRTSASEKACLQSGFVKGTAEFTQCVSVGAAVSQQFEAERARARKEETIGTGLAVEICDGHARSRLDYPVQQIISSSAKGDHVKTIDLSYRIDRTSENPDIVYATRDVRCVLRGRDLVDIDMDV